MMSQDTAELNMALKRMLIQECNVKNCTPEEIGDNDQLNGGSGKLQLDSLDAVEIVSALERNYAIRLDNPGDAKKDLRTFSTLRDYVLENGK
jgi:acyl carrier protein